MNGTENVNELAKQLTAKQFACLKRARLGRLTRSEKEETNDVIDDLSVGGLICEDLHLTALGVLVHNEVEKNGGSTEKLEAQRKSAASSTHDVNELMKSIDDDDGGDPDEFDGGTTQGDNSYQAESGDGESVSMDNDNDVPLDFNE